MSAVTFRGHLGFTIAHRETVKQFTRGIRSQTDKLDFLFQALVKTSRLETGVIQLDKKPGCLFDTVAQAMSGIVYAAEKKEITVG